MRRPIAVTTVALVAAMTLSGCLAPDQTGDAETAGTASAQVATVVPIPVGTVATGEFASLDGLTSGTVIGTYDGENITFTFPDFATGDYAQLLFAFADDELGAEDCFTDRHQVAFAYAVGQESVVQPTFGPLEYAGNPSFFSTLGVLEYPTGSPVAGECWFTTLAITPLTWSIPDLRPDLTVEDSGERSGAGGEVTLDSSGAPLTYATKAGDSLPKILERFGITAEDLLYLNPCRPVAYGPSQAYADEVLNLSKEHRGNRLDVGP